MLNLRSPLRFGASLAALALLLPALPASAETAPRAVPLVIDFGLTPAQITSTCKAQLMLARKRIDAIVDRRSARTFDSVTLALENVEADLGDNLAAQTFLFQVSGDAKVRDASQRCNNDVSTFYAQESARPDLYAALVAAEKSNTANGAAERKLQELYLVGGQRAGAGLATAQRREFVALESKISNEETQFAANLANDTSTVAVNADQAAFLPADMRTGLKTNADGKLLVPVDESTYNNFMSNEKDADARKAFYIAYARRGGQANVDLLQTAIVQRDRVAALLGYPNWSTYVAADRMAQTPQRIASFLHKLDEALLPSARQQRDELATAKGAPLDPWDVPYYANQVKKSKYSVDRDVVKQYFPAPHVIEAVLRIYSKMLGLTFTLAPDAPKWHPDVVAYNVTDTKTGEMRGTFYLDLYPRPGKFDHFENAGPTARRIMPDGTVRPVVNSILGNWPLPAAGKPSLLSHGDVITFFHEFGHNVAALCSDTPYESLNSGFRLDFVEAPSQMLENFVWDPMVLKQISSHVDTGAPLPDDLIAKMIAARHYNEAYDTVRQVFYATVDQRYHTLPPPVDTTAVWRASLRELTPSDFVDGTIPQAGFGHLMNGYEAGYYGYLWSLVYAQDIFTVFQAGGLENPAIGARYRADILAPARLYEPDEELRAFLGRAPSPEPFYRELGIAPPK